MKKNAKFIFPPVVTILFFLLFLMVFINQANTNNEINEEPIEIEWIKNNDLSSIPNEIRQGIENELRIQFETLDEDPNNNYKLYNELNDNEKNYYFQYNTSSTYNSSKDYIVIHYVTVSGRARSRSSLCDPGNPANCDLRTKKWDCGAHHKLWFDLKSSSSNISYHAEDQWSRTHDLCYGNHPCGTDEWGATEYCWCEKTSESYANDRSLTRYLNTADNGKPIIYNKLFFDYPRNDVAWDDDCWWGNRPPYHEIWWSGEKCEVYMYEAKTPYPKTYSTSFNPDEPIHNKWMDQIDFSLSPYGFDNIGVKIFLVQFYKKDNNNYQLLQDQTIVKKITEDYNEMGVKSLSIFPSRFNIDTEYDEEYYEEDEYALALGIVDKFNKAYFFKPQKFIIDRTKPEVEGDWINPEHEINSDEAIIMRWINFTDNFTLYDNNPEEQVKYIYIKMGDSNTAIPITESNDFNIDIINKEIKLANEGNYVIRELYIRDKADNRHYLITDFTEYIWDTAAPIVELDDPNDLTKYHNSNDSIKILINDDSDVRINTLKIFYNGHAYNPITLIDDFSPIDSIYVPLTVLADKEGDFKIQISVEDKIGNITSEEYDFKLDDRGPSVELYFNDTIYISNKQIIRLNHQNSLSLKVEDIHFDYFNVEIVSNVNNSSNNINLININESSSQYNSSSERYDIINLNKSSGIEIENLTLKISAFDTVGHVLSIEKTIELYDDDEPPFINTTRIEEGKYRIEVTDVSWIKKIYIKYIDLPASNTAVISDFNPLPPHDSWLTLASDIKSYDKNIYILPRYAACIFAEDIWGNVSDSDTVGIILENELPSALFIINHKSDLDLLGWMLYGNVLFRTSVSIDPAETLNIVTNLSDSTKIDFDSEVGQIKLTINGGVININSINNEIRFRGAGASAEEYKWFGIQCKSGSLNFAGSNRIYFINAVSPISYLNPSNDITLNNMEFEDCFMGIHFIDQCLSYNNLIISNMDFKNMVYGIKFDIDSYLNSFVYINALTHFTHSNCTFLNISKGDLYCPVIGLIRF